MHNHAGSSLLAILQLGIHLSLSSYSANYSHLKGTLFSQSSINEFEKPVFYTYKQDNSLFIITRGSISTEDYLTDAEISETTTDFGVFHTGFYNAASYVYKNTKELINNWNGPVYFVGHSYGASVSQILIVIAYHYKKDLDAYALSYAPMPAMNLSADDHIQDRIITIVNDDDIVPTLSIPNVNKKFKFLFPAIEKIPFEIIEKKFIELLNLMKISNKEDTRLLKNLMTSLPVVIRSVQEFARGVPKYVRYPGGNIYRLKLNKPQPLEMCRVDPEADLNKLSLQFNSISDHNSENYLKVIEQIPEE